MFKPNLPSKKKELKEARTSALKDLENYSADSDEYKKIMEHVDTLTKLIDLERRERLSPNTLAVVLGNAGIAGLILWFEKDNVVTTKVFPFLTKAKQ